MPNPEHVALLKQGLEAWNRWRVENRHIIRADLGGANLSEADLTGVRLLETVFGNANLSGARGLESCLHDGPSILDHRTLALSGNLPLSFLRGCGLPDVVIDWLPSLLDENRAIQ